MEDVRLDGRTVLITGANTGIGKETAMDMARRGARVIMACRDDHRGTAAADNVKERTGNSNIVVSIVDLASLQSIQQFATQVKETEERLDILINNAGIMGCPKSKTVDGFETQFGVNHLGHFLLTSELLPLLKASTPSRIVNVASMVYKGGKINFDDINLEKDYTPIKAYQQSKLANVLFTRELHRRIQGTGVTTYAIHPGAVNTEIGRNLHDVNCCISCLFSCIKPCFKTPASGAKTTIYCAVTEGIEQHSGRYFEDCAVKATAAVGHDDDVALRLWEVSEQMVKPADSAQTEDT